MVERMPVALRRHAQPLLVLTAWALLAGPAAAQRVTTPEEHFGHRIGADYVLPNYTQFVAYMQKLDRDSERMIVQEIGQTAEGRSQLMAIITTPENQRNLARYKDIATRLARAEGLTDEQARQLAAEGKAVVWIDGGLHATEVLGAQQLTETVYQLLSRNDPETLRILNDVIVLATHANPDGMELVSNWYMRNPNPQQRSTGGIPRLYQKYIGHDNNRDFYLAAQPESENINRILYHEWFPQIVYNHHQTGPQGTVLFAPPFRDPFNYNYDPMIPAGIDLVGAAMHTRFLAENKPGATTRRGANYSTWWNGGLRTMVYFHNMIGLLTETIGNPTPIEIPFLPNRQLPSSDLFAPIAPQRWPFRNSIDYSITANYAVLDVASRHREQFLYNIYQMGRNSIERGNRDHWTPSPKRIDAIAAATGGGRGRGGAGSGEDPVMVAGGGVGGGRGGGGAASARAWEMFRDPAARDPRGFILPADQPDFPTATKFVNALIKGGVTIHRATQGFQVAGKTYPAGSYVVKAAQAFRPHVMDMFEPQDHPNDFRFPGGPPIPPYDNAGYTLAFQMGVQFDRILEGFDGPFEKITGFARPLPGRVAQSGNGFYLSHRTNDAFIAINRLLKSGEEVLWVRGPQTIGGKTYEAGTFFIPRKGTTTAKLQQYATQLGINFDGGARPRGETIRLRPVRIGLLDRYGGSMPSGWTRWVLEQYEFPFEVVYPQGIDAGNLNTKYDVLVFVDGMIPSVRPDGEGGGRGGGGGGGGNVPEEFRAMQGNITADKSIPAIKAFLEAGGAVMAIGTSTNLVQHLGLPISDALVEQRNGEERPLPNDKFFVPGSVLKTRVDNTQPLAHGMAEYTDFFFDNSPSFKLGSDAAAKGVRRVAWFDTKEPLRSGWAWGQQYLENTVAVAEADVGRGKLFVFGPEILFRAQPHGTFKLLFNGIYYGSATGARPVSDQ
ncbi:MAG: M14 family metallopeptidase [Longimicrobiales bacterium]